jgi:hypothetical protein
VLAGEALVPLGAHRFVVADDLYQQVSFTLDASRVVSVKLEREGQKTIARRVSP